MKDLKVLLMIIVATIVTFLLRALPFVIFKQKDCPKFISYLGKYLPYSIMAMLVVYCLKGISIIKYPYGIPEIISCVIVAFLHIKKRNTLISIIGGTLCYMLLINFIFI